eukprot:1246054-Rhodomonas_salina.2
MMFMPPPPPAMTPSVAAQDAARPPPGQGYNVPPPGGPSRQPQQNQRSGTKEPAPSPTLNAKTCGLAIPSSPYVLGTNTFGVVTLQPAPCYVPGCVGHHPSHDCPKLFVQMYPGCTMPGFGENGLRAAHA